MQDRQITPSDDAQRRLQFSALYQDQMPDGISPQAASSDAFSQNIENSYIFRGTHEVTSFLEENSFLRSLLQEAYIQIKEYFPDSAIFLEVVRDPEITGYEQLLVFIAVEINAEEASQALDRLDEAWWLDNRKRAKGKLCITLEFV